LYFVALTDQEGGFPMKSAFLAFVILAICAHATAQSLSGTYTAKTEDNEVLTLSLEEHGDKTISGSMTGDGSVSRFSGRIEGNGAAGTITLQGYEQPLRFVLRRTAERQLILSVTAGSDTMPPQVFTRTNTASAAAAPKAQTTRPSTAGADTSGKTNEVRINGGTVPAEQLRTYEQRFRIRIRPGDYWYDRLCGAWGVTGGPALGFAPPGLDWGGKLRADASGGNTGIFVNGRELHAIDVMLLRQVTVVIPGRYWLDANGNYGFEGGPSLGNFVALIQSAGKPTRREGILSTIDKTGATVIGGDVLMR
jgi:hypothetical protein